jgi:cell wall assembly regulator SMI1
MQLDLREVLTRYRDWLVKNAPVLAKQLRPGLSRQQIKSAIQQSNLPLEESCFALFEVFDGQRSHKATLLPCQEASCNGLKIASVEDMESWRDGLSSDWLHKYAGTSRRINAHDGAGDAFWKEAWLPFAVGDSESAQANAAASLFLYVDFDPVAGGKFGQVIQNNTEVELNEEGIPTVEFVTRKVVAPSVSQYFAWVVSALESGQAGFQRGRGIVWR